jgi:hypothetical protein
MVPTPEIKSRIDLLNRELDREIDHTWPKAATNYWLSIVLMLITILSSLIAGLAGLLKQLSQEQIGAIALIPGGIALLVSSLKFPGKSDFHYHRINALKALKSRLLLQLPEVPNAEQIAAIARDRDKLLMDMDEEWRRSFPLTWTSFEGKAVKSDQG